MLLGLLFYRANVQFYDVTLCNELMDALYELTDDGN